MPSPSSASPDRGAPDRPSRRGLTPRRGWLALILCLLLPLTHAAAQASSAGAADRPDATLVMVGPAAAIDLLDQGRLRLSDGVFFVPRDAALRILRAAHRSTANLVGILHDGNPTNWYGVLRFIPAGFVPAAEARNWSPEDLLVNIRRRVARKDAARAAQGLPPRQVRDWQQPPVYDDATHSLVWAPHFVPADASATVSGEAAYHVAVFGRQGYFQLDMTVPVDLDAAPERTAAALVNGLRFIDGRGYDDFDPAADPVAAAGFAQVFGLTTLRRERWYEQAWNSDLLVPGLAGGSLVLGAGVLGLQRLYVRHQRLRRRI
jgi:uncharacterized membrane-anchored protein